MVFAGLKKKNERAGKVIQHPASLLSVRVFKLS